MKVWTETYTCLTSTVSWYTVAGLSATVFPIPAPLAAVSTEILPLLLARPVLSQSAVDLAEHSFALSAENTLPFEAFCSSVVGTPLFSNFWKGRG